MIHVQEICDRAGVYGVLRAAGIQELDALAVKYYGSDLRRWWAECHVLPIALKVAKEAGVPPSIHARAALNTLERTRDAFDACPLAAESYRMFGEIVRHAGSGNFEQPYNHELRMLYAELHRERLAQLAVSNVSGTLRAETLTRMIELQVAMHCTCGEDHGDSWDAVETVFKGALGTIARHPGPFPTESTDRLRALDTASAKMMDAVREVITVEMLLAPPTSVALRPRGVN